MSSKVEMVALVTSELASNAVTHAGTAFTVAVSRRNGTLGVAVGDLSFSHPEGPISGRALNERGRGMTIVASLSASWGVTPLRDGKLVWATFDVADGEPIELLRRTACHEEAESLHDLRTDHDP